MNLKTGHNGVMKVAVMLPRFPALSETFILDRIIGMVERELDVCIFSDSARDEAKVHPDIGRHGLLARTTYLQMPRNKLIRLKEGMKLIVRQNSGADVARHMRLLNFSQYGKDAIRLKLLFQAERHREQRDFDIIHCEYGTAGNEAAALREAGILNGRIVTTFLGADISLTVRARPRIYDRLWRQGDCFLPISEAAGNKLVALGCDRDRIRVHHLGVDCGRLRFADRAALPGSPVRLLTVCRLVEKKGVEHAIRAIARVRELLPHRELQYAVVGDGPLRGELLGLSRVLCLEGTVDFLGSMDREEVAAEYQRAHLFVLPSQTARNGDEEGIPVSLMEAMASGIPVLSTVHSGIPELVQDGVSGFLVPERDSEALAERLKSLLEHPELWSAFGRAGRARVEQDFNLNRLNDQLVELYHELLSSLPPSRRS